MDKRSLTYILSLSLACSIVVFISRQCAARDKKEQSSVRLVFTQIPAGGVPQSSQSGPEFLPPLRNIPTSRIVSLDLREGAQEPWILTPEFESACSPVVSFDGKRLAFAGKRESGDPWNIWEMDADGGNKRRIVEVPADCLTPAYLSSIYTLDNLSPRDQIVFATAATGAVNERGAGQAWSLCTCELSGKELRRITFNLSADFDPTVLPDGRILFASWQGYGSRYYPTGLFSLLVVNTDGTDVFPFYGNHELPILKCKPVIGDGGWIYFVESDASDPLGGGNIAAVNLRRNLKTYTPIATDSEGLYYSPSPLAEGRLIVSYRHRREAETYGLYELSPQTGQIMATVFDDPAWHEVEAKVIAPRLRPKGRSSVVNYEFHTADIFCMDCYLSDWPGLKDIAPGSLRGLRIIEGIPLRGGVVSPPLADGSIPGGPGTSDYSATPFGPRRILGEIPLPEDGSFYIRVPAGTPISFQVLDENKMAVATHRSWMWGMPKENRGCIGCHEDRELTPPNRLTDALKEGAANLTLPPEKRRTVDFKHEIAPLVERRCLQCHTRDHPRLDLADLKEPPASGDAAPRFPRTYQILLSPSEGGAEGVAGRYVKPGSARESPLIWHIFGQRLAEEAGYSGNQRGFALMPPRAPLSDSEGNLFVEWIDLGAQWNNRPSPADVVEGQWIGRQPSVTTRSEEEM
jgi:hypothetical protein